MRFWREFYFMQTEREEVEKSWGWNNKNAIHEKSTLRNYQLNWVEQRHQYQQQSTTLSKTQPQRWLLRFMWFYHHSVVRCTGNNQNKMNHIASGMNIWKFRVFFSSVKIKFPLTSMCRWFLRNEKSVQQNRFPFQCDDNVTEF